MKHLLFTLVLVVSSLCLFSSCSKKSLFVSDEEKFYKIDGAKDTVEGEMLTLDSTILSPMTLQCVDSFLIVMNDQSGSLLNVFNSYNDSLLSQFGDLGRARNEFLSPVTHFYTSRPSKEKLLLHIQNGGEMVQNVDLYASIRSNACVMEKPIKHVDIGFYTASYFLENGDQLIHKSAHAADDVRDGDVNPPYTEIISGKDVHCYSPFSAPIVGDAASVFNAYSQTHKMSPDLSRLVEIPFFANLFYIFDVKEGKYICVREKEGHDFDDLQDIVSKYTAEEAVKQLVFYNVELCVSDNFIFLIHDGHRFASEIDTGDWTGFTPDIRIFDKDGNYINTVVLKESIYYIAYNEITRKFYGIDSNKDIYVYDISKYLK